MSDNVDNFLAHYGVRGMKWGQRKQASTISKKDARRELMKDKHLDEIVDRRRKEKQVKKLLDEDLNPYRTATKNFVDDLLKENGGATIASVALAGASTAAGMAFMAYRLNRSLSGISMSPIPLR